MDLEGLWNRLASTLATAQAVWIPSDNSFPGPILKVSPEWGSAVAIPVMTCMRSQESHYSSKSLYISLISTYPPQWWNRDTSLST